MVVALTEKAAGEIKRRLAEAKQEPDTMVRIGISGGGCGGYQYDFRFDKTYSEAEDDKFECHGVPVVVDKRSGLLLEGTEVDYVEGLQGSGFAFKNPNAVKSCGCGTSFQA